MWGKLKHTLSLYTDLCKGVGVLDICIYKVEYYIYIHPPGGGGGYYGICSFAFDSFIPSLISILFIPKKQTPHKFFSFFVYRMRFKPSWKEIDLNTKVCVPHRQFPQHSHPFMLSFALPLPTISLAGARDRSLFWPATASSGFF